MKRIYLILLGLVLGISMTGCYGDKGNYDYHWIQDIAIDTLLKDATVSRSQVLNIEVDLKKFILDSENETEPANPEDYTYEWKAITNSDENPLTEDLVLSTEKDLNDTIWLSPGRYQINYSVTEKNSGVTWITYFHLTVVNNYTGGHVFMTEDANQNVELELWANVPGATERIHETGVLARAGYPYTGGGANLVKNISGHQGLDGLWIATGENTGFLNMPDFTWKETNLMSMYMVVPEEEYNIKNITYSSANVLMFYSASGSIHLCPYRKLNIYSTITYTNNIEFEAAPYYGGGKDENSNYGMIVYDQINKRFVSYKIERGTMGTVNASCYESSGDTFDGYDIVNMSDQYNGSDIIAIMKDAGGIYYVCDFRLRANNSGSPEGYLLSQYKIDGDLSNASYTVIDKNNGFFYWSQGNKVYVSYNPSNGDTGTCEEVTLQDTEGNPVTITDDICMLTQCNNNLCIATWSDTNKGKAYIVSTNQSDSRLLTVQNIFETNNPVKSVTTW